MSGVYTIHHSDISFCLGGGEMNRCVVENWYRSERFSYSDTELWRWSYLSFTFCVSKRLFLHWCVIGVLAFVPRSPAPNYVRLLRNERNIGQSIFVFICSVFFFLQFWEIQRSLEHSRQTQQGLDVIIASPKNRSDVPSTFAVIRKNSADVFV